MTPKADKVQAGTRCEQTIKIFMASKEPRESSEGSEKLRQTKVSSTLICHGQQQMLGLTKYRRYRTKKLTIAVQYQILQSCIEYDTQLLTFIVQLLPAQDYDNWYGCFQENNAD